MKRKIVTLLAILDTACCFAFGVSACGVLPNVQSDFSEISSEEVSEESVENSEEYSSEESSSESTESSSTETSSETESSSSESSSETSVETHTHTFLKLLNVDALKSKATCTTPAIYYVSCACGEIGTETFEYGEANGHTETIPATCTRKAFCGICKDEFGEPLGHLEIKVNGKPASCTEAGLTDGIKCGRCSDDEIDFWLVIPEIIDETGHTEVIDAAVAPTCTATGLTEGKHCDVCGGTLVAQEEVSATGHTEAIDAAVAPTCTETGLTEGKHCDVCGETLVAQEEIDANGHTYENGFCIICKEKKVSQGLKYTLSEDEKYYIVSGKGTCKDTDIIIPSTYNNLPVTAIGNSAFNNHTTLASIEIPDSITSIGTFAFSSCTNLTSVKIGNSVTSIGDLAFNNCSRLKSIELPNLVTAIGESAFSGCNCLKNIKIPDSVTSIGFAAFYDTVDYTNQTNWENGVLYIGKHLIESKTDITGEYKIKEGTLCIADSAFSARTGLTSVIIPDSVISIGDYAFAWCDITSIEIGNSVKFIGNGAFDTCKNLTNLNLPASIIAIGNSAFNYCIYITSITIPNSVTSIGLGAFSNCYRLTSIEIPASVSSISGCPFDNCVNLTSIKVSESNDSYKSIDGNLYTKDGKILIQYAVGKTDTSFTIPNTVTSIGRSAFSGCYNLKSIKIPDSVTSIGEEAFSSCSGLVSIEISDSVTSIEWSAFDYCNNLKTVYYNGTIEEWTALKANIGSNNSYLTNATIYYYIENEADVPTDGGKYWHYVDGVPTAW